MEIHAAALSGMHQAEVRLETTAKRLARASDPTDTVDLSAEMVALLESRNAFAANADVLKSTDELEKAILDLLG